MGARDAAKHSTVHGTAPTRELPDPTMSIVLRLRHPAIEVFKVRISPDKPAGCQEGTHRSHFPGKIITGWSQLSLSLATSEFHSQVSQS